MNTTPVTRTLPQCPMWCTEHATHEVDRHDPNAGYYFHSADLLRDEQSYVSVGAVQPFAEQTDIEPMTDIGLTLNSSYPVDEARRLALAILTACEFAEQGTSACPVWCDDHYEDPEVPGEDVHMSRVREAGGVKFVIGGGGDVGTVPTLFAFPAHRGMPAMPLTGHQELEVARLLAPWVFCVLRAQQG